MYHFFHYCRRNFSRFTKICKQLSHIRSVFRHLQFLFYFLMCNWFRRRCKFRCLLFRKLRAAVLRNIVTSQFINRLIKAVSSNKYEAIKRIVCSSNSVIVAIPRICFWFNAKSREFFHVKLISFSLNWVTAALKIIQQVSTSCFFNEIFKIIIFQNLLTSLVLVSKCCCA